MAGAIRWVRSLFHRIKHTILPFLEVPEMLEGEQSKAVSCFTVAQLYRFGVNIKLFRHDVTERLYVSFAAFCSGQGQVRGNGSADQGL